MGTAGKKNRQEQAQTGAVVAFPIATNAPCFQEVLERTVGRILDDSRRRSLDPDGIRSKVRAREEREFHFRRLPCCATIFHLVSLGTALEIQYKRPLWRVAFSTRGLRIVTG